MTIKSVSNQMSTGVLACPFDFPLSKDQICTFLSISPKTLSRYLEVFNITSDSFDQDQVKNLFHLKESLANGYTYRQYIDTYLSSQQLNNDSYSILADLFVQRCESEFEKLLPNVPMLINQAFDNVVFRYENQIRETYRSLYGTEYITLPPSC